MFKPNIFIQGREISSLKPPYVIAELSGNHKGDLSQALTMIDRAASTGVDAIKIQDDAVLAIQATAQDLDKLETPFAVLSLGLSGKTSNK